MDILDQILTAQKGSRDEKIETFRSLFAEDDKQDGDPCWKGYKQVGMKKKNGKDVPNCVPEETTNPIKEDNVAVKSANAKANRLTSWKNSKPNMRQRLKHLKTVMREKMIDSKVQKKKNQKMMQSVRKETHLEKQMKNLVRLYIH